MNYLLVNEKDYSCPLSLANARNVYSTYSGNFTLYIEAEGKLKINNKLRIKSMLTPLSNEKNRLQVCVLASKQNKQSCDWPGN